jgi:cell division protease FtsH
MQEFEDAKDKVMMGAERRSMVMTDDEKKMTAYHEAGHAIVAVHEPASDPIHKATIIPRGRALGMVMRLPERDNYSYHRDKMHAEPRRSAWAAASPRRSSSATTRSRRAPRRTSPTPPGLAPQHGHQVGHVGQARPAAVRGPVRGQPRHGRVAADDGLGRDQQADRTEIRSLVDGAHKRATDLLTTHQEQLHLLAQALLEYETLTGERSSSCSRTARSTA